MSSKFNTAYNSESFVENTLGWSTMHEHLLSTWRRAATACLDAQKLTFQFFEQACKKFQLFYYLFYLFN